MPRSLADAASFRELASKFDRVATAASSASKQAVDFAAVLERSLRGAPATPTAPEDPNGGGGARKAPSFDDGYRHATMQAAMDHELAEMHIEERNTPKTFVRDTPEMQQAVREDYLSGLGRAADGYSAGMKQALAKGPAVVRDEGELDDLPTLDGPTKWLTDYMAEQESAAAEPATGAVAVDASLDGTATTGQT